MKIRNCEWAERLGKAYMKEETSSYTLKKKTKLNIKVLPTHIIKITILTAEILKKKQLRGR